MWTLDLDAEVPHWRPRPAPSGVVLAFSTRQGGVSDSPYDTLNLGRSTADRPEAVDENRRRMLAALGFDHERLATAGQIHGVQVALADRPGIYPNCDALVTRTPGVVLAVTAADCLPILLSAPGAVGAAHSGWRGTADGIPREVLRAMCDVAQVGPDRIDVHLGPSIRSCCYRVGPEVAERFDPRCLRRAEGSWQLDLIEAARLQMIEAGAAPGRIAVIPACTASEPSWYFSHRRDGGASGRQWGIAALDESEAGSLDPDDGDGV